MKVDPSPIVIWVVYFDNWILVCHSEDEALSHRDDNDFLAIAKFIEVID